MNEYRKNAPPPVYPLAEERDPFAGTFPGYVIERGELRAQVDLLKTPPVWKRWAQNWNDTDSDLKTITIGGAVVVAAIAGVCVLAAQAEQDCLDRGGHEECHPTTILVSTGKTIVPMNSESCRCVGARP